MSLGPEHPDTADSLENVAGLLYLQGDLVGNALQALAGALQALPAKLSDAQANQALDLVLKQIGQTTNPFARAEARSCERSARRKRPVFARASDNIIDDD